jgi:signal transduction histidine kinase
LERIDDPVRQKDKLQNIKEQAERLEKLIQDVLTVSKLDQIAKAVPVRDPVDMVMVLQSVAAHLRPRAEAKHQQLNLDLAPDIPIFHGNQEDLWRMVANLVENAINYTPSSGQITIKAHFQAQDIVIFVQDNGMGISEAQLPRIFERFYRADSARSIKNGGTGLGLSIVKLIAEQHGGEVKVESQLGKGSCFQVWLPV